MFLALCKLLFDKVLLNTAVHHSSVMSAHVSPYTNRSTEVVVTQMNQTKVQQRSKLQYAFMAVDIPASMAPIDHAPWIPLWPNGQHA